MAYQLYSVKNGIRLAALLLLLAVLIADLALDDYFLRNSAEETINLQQNGKNGLRTFSDILSGPFTYWVPVFLFLYIFFNRDITYMLFIVTLYVLAFTIVFVLKAVYYKGRPFVIRREIIGCSCDPGMPSGHAIMSMIGYYILYRVITDTHWLTSKCRYLYRALLAIFCVVIVLAISFSRMVLGAHSYIQLIFALIIGINLILYITYPNFKRFLRYMRGRFRVIALGYAFFLVLFIPTMAYINQVYRQDYDFWRFWASCPRCNFSFVLGQTQSLAITFFLPAFYYFFPIKYVLRDQDLDLPDPEEQETLDKRKGKGTILARFAIYIAVILPAGILFLVFYLAIRNPLYEMSTLANAMISGAIYSIVALYAGFAVGGFKTWIYHKCNLTNTNDYIDIKYLIREHKISLYGPPTEPVPGQPLRHYHEEGDIFGRTSADNDPRLRKNRDLLDNLLQGRHSVPEELKRKQ